MLLGIADGRTANHWPTLLGGLVLTAPVWWRALRAAGVWPEGRAFGDTLYFYLSPLLLAGALYQVAPDRFEADPGLLPLLVVDNCNGLTDDGDITLIGLNSYYADIDQDSYGAGAAMVACIQPGGSSLNAGDCNDNNAAINPAANEICNDRHR